MFRTTTAGHRAVQVWKAIRAPATPSARRWPLRAEERAGPFRGSPVLPVTAQPVQDHLEPLDAVERAPRPGQLVAFRREPHELHLALHGSQSRAEVLALAHRATQVV